MKNELGEIVIYQADDGKSSLRVHLYEDSLWLSLTQISELFSRDKSVIFETFEQCFQLRRAST